MEGRNFGGRAGYEVKYKLEKKEIHISKKIKYQNHGKLSVN